MNKIPKKNKNKNCLSVKCGTSYCYEQHFHILTKNTTPPPFEQKYDKIESKPLLVLIEKEMKGSNSRIIFKQNHEKDAILYL